jgi:hypothetical protein
MREAKILLFLITILLALPSGRLWAQNTSANDPTRSVNVVQATIVTIDYQHCSGATAVGFQGSSLFPLAKGRAKVSAKAGRLQINAEFSKFETAQNFGDEFLTYVLWAITPEGKAENLGEILLDGDKSKIAATTALLAFGLIVTAEPYFAVSEPSNIVVFQNEVLAKTGARIEKASASYRLLDHAAYGYGQSVGSVQRQKSTSKIPLEILEARNAVQIAMNVGAQKYAPDLLNKAQDFLSQAQNLLASNGSNQMIAQASRDAMKTADNAWHIALQHQEEARSKPELTQIGKASLSARPQQ